jgi:hypothetical protein
VSVVISPRAAEAAVWTASKIVIMPLGTSKPATVSIDLLTPRPSATPRATAVPSVAATPPPSIEPGASPVATEKATPTLAPATTQPPAPTVTPAAGQAIAILDGYTVVGRNPEFSPNGVWVAFSARRVGAASGSDVYVWRVGWDRAQAVTTGHAALFAGWLGQRTLITQFGSAVPAPTAPAASAQPSDSSAPTPAPATAVPAAPAAIVATSYVYDPATAAAGRIDRPMLMPVVDPMGRYVVYWAGTVRLDASSGLWVPSQGDFYFDTWTNIPVVSASLTVAPAATPVPTPIPTPAPTATPTEIAATPSPAGTATATSPASPGTEKPAVGQAPSLGQASAPPDVGPSLPQLLPVASKPGTLTGWSVKWDASGQYMAIWVANPGSLDVGHVFLFDVIPGQNLLDVDGVLLSTSARSNIAFDDSQFVYTSPTQGGDGKTYLFALPAVPPPPAATPTATVAAVDSTRPAPTDSAAASTDRPGS